MLAAATSTATAQISNDVVRIGVLTDLSSWGRDNSGPGSVEAAKMAVEEFGSTVLGKPIEIVSADHQMKTDVGLQIVRDWFDNGKVDAVADIPNSGIAIAVHNMVRERNKIALLSGPGASSLTDELCSPNTVHFAYDTYALSKVTASAVLNEGGKSWFFVTADYAFGQQLEKDATRFIKELDGKVLGSVRHPTNTADFSSFVLQAQNSKADVVAFANAGQDTDNAIKQSGEYGLVQSGQKLVGLLMFDTDVHAIGLQAAQGTYMTTASYWNMDEKTRAWSRRFFARTKVMPTMIHTGVYGAVLHYLKAIKAAGTDDPAAVMAKMRDLPIGDAFVHGGKLREDGRVIRDMYLARVKKPSESKEPWDYLEIVKTVKGENAYRPVSESKCALLKK
ncbi:MULTISPECIES: ABC transporter substrate-binding protein [unclassified Bradyrhizobium]|uniref:ABC transporter substrate-binding protein n=1 Tax=unclassified Bradyrhizobium TaxID=2631580 RepID=UPI001BA856AD|nr:MULTISPECIES: ABC transporter substrate-binding protein [unclassified Bradyrhizobium]MBR1203016.1 ABC transporter substrate-binding protein [Bradyrhizobium sp. AUGA SZCCT0124]MBR1314431.1 ABC transporter substrate-binding protein [Bradyrhizobium sp. AUGA SZCCT0051]MBR1342551.1 ABC transporter substrate-binding protein [Bradyrhizobium sp. AUGA SZCCT0105]MBR1352781.1 ABC transporter substrate-binding protein [Bradyrhizobium sp. AUGA SZCCT0045]